MQIKKEKNMPKVSIILPTYNGGRFLEGALAAIINQSFKDWELIVVNDCSTDNTLTIANKFAKIDKRISVYSNKINKKLPATLNAGFAKAIGKYLTWTSDDNIAKPNWLETLVCYLNNNPNVDMVSATMDYIDENNNFLSKTDLEKTSLSLAYRCNVGAAFMYRKSIADKIGNYDENTFCAEDYDYWCRMALNGVIKYIPDNIYMYRRNSKSLTVLQRTRVLDRTRYIQNKYHDEFIKKFKLNYLQRLKLEYLLYRKHKPIFVFFDIYKFFVRNLTNILLFWSPQIRKTIYNNLKIKL